MDHGIDVRALAGAARRHAKEAEAERERVRAVRDEEHARADWCHALGRRDCLGMALDADDAERLVLALEADGRFSPGLRYLDVDGIKLYMPYRSDSYDRPLPRQVVPCPRCGAGDACLGTTIFSPADIWFPGESPASPPCEACREKMRAAAPVGTPTLAERMLALIAEVVDEHLAELD